MVEHNEEMLCQGADLDRVSILSLEFRLILLNKKATLQ